MEREVAWYTPVENTILSLSLVIDYSDGVIQAVPDASKVLCDYAAAKNKPLLGYQEDFGDAYEAFYESLYADEAK